MTLYALSNQSPNHGLSYYNACSSSLQKETAASKLSQTILGEQEIESLISVLPETQKLEDVVDQFYYTLHNDKKLSQFSTFFSQILADNPEAFKDLTADQKAQILFDKYRELTLNNLLKAPEYQDAYQALQQKIGSCIEDATLAEKLYKSCLSRIHQLHSDFVAFAVADPLQSKPTLVHFSSDYQPHNLNLSHVQISSLEA